ncbi:translational machinery component [Xylariomycetidae sp. FL2044]|nr:translational machinery component [Xylariomycetidae sp. FL2044]
MTRSTTNRLLATTTSRLSQLSLKAKTNANAPVRNFSQTCRRSADAPRPRSSLLNMLNQNKAPSPTPTARPASPAPRGGGGMDDLSRLIATDVIGKARNQPTSSQFNAPEDMHNEEWGPIEEPFHFHIYAHKHNTHITVTKPNRNAIISMSTGNIGFKKSKRGSYDAAFQLMAYVLDKLNQLGWHKKISRLEVALRGFGSGREAATKLLLSNQGKLMRDKVVSVSDATRIKFGGTRSQKPRRLG